MHKKPLSIERIYKIGHDARTRISIDDLNLLLECHPGQRHTIFDTIGYHIAIKDYMVWEYIQNNINQWDVQMAVSVIVRLPMVLMETLITKLKPNKVLEIGDKARRQLPFKNGALHLRYIDLSIVIIKRFLVYFLSDTHHSYRDFYTTWVMLITVSELHVYDPWLLRNVKEVFDLDRHINKMKLIGDI